MSQNIEYTAIQKCFDTALDLLGSGTVDLTSFGQELVSASFLGQAALNNILNTPGHTTNDKASKLLQCVSAQVKTNPEKSYKAYLDILEHRPALITLLNEIKKEYGLLQSPAIPSPEPTSGGITGSSKETLPDFPHNNPQSPTIPEPTSESLPDSPHGPGLICPCGGCDLWTFLEGKCPKKDSGTFPYLDKKDLKQHEKNILKAKLEEESRDIKLKFVLLVQKTMKWLTEQSNPLFTPMQLKNRFLKGAKVYMKNSKRYTYEDFFDALENNYVWSWFSFDVLKSIIVLMSDGNLTVDFENYRKEFEKYCSQRRLYECPTYFSKALGKRHSSILVEFPADIDDMTLLDLKKKLEVKLALIIDVKRRDLVLLTYKDGSTVLVYSLPRAVADKAFPLSPEEEEMLAMIGVSKCYLYNEPKSQEIETSVHPSFSPSSSPSLPVEAGLSESLEQYKAMTKEMEKKVASISTHLQSYKESVENLPMEQSVKSREDQELYKVLAKEADELKIVISKREKARKKASVEKERQEISKEKNEKLQPDPSKCKARGPGIRKEAFVNSIATFEVSVRNHNNRPCTLSHQLTAELKFENDAVTVEVEKVSCNAYTGLSKLRYTATKRGKCELCIAVNGFSIRGSPFKVEVSIPPIKGFTFPYGIAINSQAEMVVVSECTGNKISLLTEKGVQHLIDGEPRINKPQGIAVDSEGCIYVCDEDNCVKKFKADGTFLKSSAKGLLKRPRGLKMNDDKLYVCDRFNYRIGLFDTELNYLNRSIGGLGVFRDPWDISFDSKSNLYVTDHVLNCIKVFDQEGMYLREFGEKGSNDGQFRDPTCIHIHEDLVYVSDYGNNRVCVFTTSGEFKYNFGKFGTGAGEFYSPRGIAIDKGLVYVCDLYNGRVQIFEERTDYN